MPGILAALGLIGIIFLFAGEDWYPVSFHVFAGIVLVAIAAALGAPEWVQLLTLLAVIASALRWLWNARRPADPTDTEDAADED